MKKILILTIITSLSLSFISCSKDDDEPNVTPTSIYGTWSLDYYINNGVLVEDIICNEQITYSFLSNNTYTKTTYAGEGSTNCDVAVIINGTFEIIDENEYVLIPNGSDSNETLNIIFLDNDTKFKTEYTSAYIEVYSK
jgi:hypothetical protein